MKIEIDSRDLTVFGDDLKRAAKRADAEIKPIIKRGAMNIKKQLRKEMFASDHFKGAGSAIAFDLFAGPGGIWAEIGPSSEGGSPGNLANIAYFGTSRGGGTVPDPKGALEAEAPNVEKYLTDLIEKALR